MKDKLAFSFILTFSFSHPLKVKLETINIYHTDFLREWCDKDSFETTYAFLIVTAQQAFFSLHLFSFHIYLLQVSMPTTVIKAFSECGMLSNFL